MDLWHSRGQLHIWGHDQELEVWWSCLRVLCRRWGQGIGKAGRVGSPTGDDWTWCFLSRRHVRDHIQGVYMHMYAQTGIIFKSHTSFTQHGHLGIYIYTYILYIYMYIYLFIWRQLNINNMPTHPYIHIKKSIPKGQRWEKKKKHIYIYVKIQVRASQLRMKWLTSPQPDRPRHRLVCQALLRHQRLWVTRPAHLPTNSTCCMHVHLYACMYIYIYMRRVSHHMES